MVTKAKPNRRRPSAAKPRPAPLTSMARERGLVASILALADKDCEEGGIADAVPAYRWIVDRSGAFDLYCGLLELDPEIVRDLLIRKHMRRCEPMLRRAKGLD